MIKLVKIIFVFNILTFTHNLLYSQTVTWQRLYDGPSHFSDAANDICQTKDSNFVVVGYTHVLHFAQYILKINGKGDTIWSESIGGYLPGQLALSVAPSNDGGCVLTGDADTSFTIKFDSQGNILWHKRYMHRYVQCYAIRNTLDGGYIACGRILGIGGYVFKIDSLGNFLWEKIFPGEFTSFTSVDVAHNSGFILSGYIYDTPTNDTVQAVVVRIDESGNQIWQKRYSLLNGCDGEIIRFSNNGYLLSGNTTRNKIPDPIALAYFINLDTNGNQLYSKVFDSNISEYLGDFDIINNNRYLITLGFDSGNVANSKLLITDSTGNIIKEKIYQSTKYLYIKSAIETYTKDFVFAGEWGLNATGNRSDIYVLRADSNLNAPPIVGINPNQIELPAEFVLYPSYPNPFNPNTTIKYEISKAGIVELEIFNLEGRQICNLINKFHQTGKYEIQFNSRQYNLSSGIYYCRMSVQNKSGIIKLVLIK